MTMTYFRNQKTAAENRARVSAALSDGAILAEMKQILRQHLNAALLECSAVARDFTDLDADVVMQTVRHNFDPMDSASPVQDAFSDGFGAHHSAVNENGGDWGRETGRMPSGALQAPHQNAAE